MGWILLALASVFVLGLFSRPNQYNYHYYDGDQFAGDDFVEYDCDYDCGDYGGE